MSKSRNKGTDTPVDKTSFSTGTRGESAFSRDISGNHHGNRRGTLRRPSSGRVKKNR
jgi:hypothetical protein